MVKEPYIASLSDQLRFAAQLVEGTTQKIQTLAEDAVNTIVDTEGVADSLKGDIAGVFKSLRQIDMKNERNEIIVKTFTGWNKDKDCWHVFIEFPFENYWEERHRSVGKG